MVGHLPPQPAALLALLIDRVGEVVTREEIRAALWHDVTVDFDGSLHHCVRQVRVALGDRAKSPRFIETIPRRGYRLRPTAVGHVASSPARALEPASEGSPATDAAPAAELSLAAVESSSTTPSGTAPPPADSSSAVEASPASAAPPRSPWPKWLPLVLVLLVAALAAWGLPSLGREPAELRVAVMGFGSAAGRSPEADRIGEQVLADLANRRPDAAIVGPRTTEPLREQGLSLPRIATTLDVAYVLNVRHLSGETASLPPSMLVELIRTSDGKHVWVRRYEQLTDWRRIAAEITEGTAATLPGLPVT